MDVPDQDGGPVPPRPGKSQNYRVPYQYGSESLGKSQSYQVSNQCWAYHLPASETPFKWRFGGGPMMARF